MGQELMKFSTGLPSVKGTLEQELNSLNKPLPLEIYGWILNSLLLGFLLCFLIYWSERKINSTLKKISKSSSEGEEKEKNKNGELFSQISGAANFLYLTVGISGLMILINNNFTRALAIAAAISLTRFRVKLGGSTLSAHILFAILIGVSTGLGEFYLSWFFSLIFIFLMTTWTFMVCKFH